MSDFTVNTLNGINFVQVDSNTGRWMSLGNNNYVNSNITFNISSVLTLL